MSVKIRELAAACGLSVSTVSKALNEYSDVSEETRRRVREAAARLGYHPSAVARGLKTGRSMNLGVIYQDAAGRGLTHSYFSAVLQAFREEAESRGYDITFISAPEGMSLLDRCRIRSVDGVCVVCSPPGDPGVRELAASTLPFVSVDAAFSGRPCVASDNAQGMEALTEYALSLGCRRIAFVHGEDVPVSRIRIRTFRRTLAKAGVPLQEGYLSPALYHNPRATRAATERLLALPQPPDCIFMPDDSAALGGLEALRAHPLRVPEEIGVAGFDGVSLIQMCRPKLTSVRQDTDAIGRSAASTLIRCIEQPGSVPAETVSVPCELLRGETLAGAR